MGGADPESQNPEGPRSDAMVRKESRQQGRIGIPGTSRMRSSRGLNILPQTRNPTHWLAKWLADDWMSVGISLCSSAFSEPGRGMSTSISQQ